MSKNKHMSLDDRITISSMLDDRQSFKKIGKAIEKDCTAVSREIRNHLVFQKTGAYGKAMMLETGLNFNVFIADKDDLYKNRSYIVFEEMEIVDNK